MSIRNPIYIPLLATGPITPNRLVKAGSADQSGALAAAATDKVIGVSVATVTAASGETFDVCVGGEYEVIAGGVVTRGDFVVSDANGAGVAGVAGNATIGRALDSAVAGDIFTVQVRPVTA